jgi:hypothetical protein
MSIIKSSSPIWVGPERNESTYQDIGIETFSIFYKFDIITGECR